ncbi:MAG: flagellar hook-length control protein FliK [Treponema sp.]|nr:flagellar hook-length control protein FliK [Treponema sp.]
MNPLSNQQDLQNFKPNKDTFNTQYSSSFEDLISFYKEMNESPVSEGDKIDNTISTQEKTSEKKVETADSENKSEENSKVEQKSSEDKESSETVKTDNSSKEKTEVKKTEKTEIKKTDEKLIPQEKKEKFQSVSEKIKVKEEEKGEKKPQVEKKKLTNKDFARMEELTEDKVLTNPQDALNKTLANVERKSDNKSEKKEIESDSNPKIADLSTESKALENFVEEVKNQNTENNSSDSGKKENQKSFTLDKEGKIVVEDLRTVKTEVSEEIVSDNQEKKNSLKVSDIKMTDDNNAVITMDLANNAQADLLSINTQTAAANGSNFQAMLSNQIQSNASEFVKAGTLVLKDNNQGTINLVLHPDDLGNVKVHLSLDGKTMSAHITVSSKEALQVFKENSETLREAFIKGGFDVSEFEVAYNDGGSFNQNMDFGGQQEQNNFVANKVYNNIGGGAVADVENPVEKNDEFSNYSINIVA